MREGLYQAGANAGLTARETRPNSFARLDKVEGQLQEARTQLADLSAQQPDITSLVDRDTALRLQDIERDLGQPALARKQRTSLEQEREMILGTIDPNDRLPRQAERAQQKQIADMQARIARLEQQHGEARATADAAVADLRRKLGRHGEEFQPEQVMDATPFQEPADFAAAIDRADLMRQARIVREHVMPMEEGAPEGRGGETAVGPAGMQSRAGPDNLAQLDRNARALIAATPSGKAPVRVEVEDLAPKTTKFAELRRRAFEVYSKFIGTTVKNEATGREIRFDPTGQRKSTSGAGEDLLRLVPKIPELLREAVPLGAPEADRAGRAEIVAWHKFNAPVDLGGRRFDVILTVRELKNGEFHYALNKDLEGGSAGGRRGLPAPEDRGGAVGSSALEGPATSELNLAVC